MQAFESIMNRTGQKVLHFLFLLSVLFYCKTCAAYLQKAETDFKCPICALLKLVQTNHSTIFEFPTASSEVYFNTLNVVVTTISAEEIVKKSINQPLKFCFTHKDYGIELGLSYAKTLGRFFHLSNSKLYLLFEQLKIGNTFLV
jgi:hypothetical protein